MHWPAWLERNDLTSTIARNDAHIRAHPHTIRGSEQPAEFQTKLARSAMHRISPEEAALLTRRFPLKKELSQHEAAMLIDLENMQLGNVRPLVVISLSLYPEPPAKSQYPDEAPKALQWLKRLQSDVSRHERGFNRIHQFLEGVAETHPLHFALVPDAQDETSVLLIMRQEAYMHCLTKEAIAGMDKLPKADLARH